MPEPAPNMDPETGEITAEETNRPFTAVLNEIRHGATVTEMRDELAEVVKAVIATEKAGSVTLTLNVALADSGEAVFVADKITSKVPKPTVQPSLFFPDAKGDLTRKNPRQMELGDGLRRVPNE